MWEKRWFQFAILLLLAFIWGSSFILIKVGLRSFSNEQAAVIRIFLASVALIPFAVKNRKYFKRKDLKSLLIAGFIGSFFPAFLFTKAQTQIDSALAGILNSLTPVFTLVIGILFHRSKVKIRQLIGLFLGLTGAVGLVATGSGLTGITINYYALYIVLATLMYGVNINEVKSHLTHLTGIQITSFSFMFIGPAAFIYMLTLDFSQVADSPGWGWHLLALAALAVVGTSFALLLMNSLIRYTSAIFASSVTYIIPVFAILWGILDHEKIGVADIVFMVIILVGVYLINRQHRKNAKTI
ncbi:MAG: DMT family transporter [Bacteroidales bacterium]|nr:DMT family transporter [Bacteroidales bacterium]